MLVHEFTNPADLSVKFTHQILLVVLIMHHIKTFCHLLNRKNKTILVTPIPTEKAFFFLPPLVKRCFFSQDLSIIAAYSLLHIFHKEKFENRVLIRMFPCLILHIQIKYFLISLWLLLLMKGLIFHQEFLKDQKC